MTQTATAIEVEKRIVNIGLALPQEQAPITIIPEHVIDPSNQAALVVVDEIFAFCVPGYGPLAPRREEPTITRMIILTDTLASRFQSRGWPIIVSKDCHDGIEFPWPLHAQRGTVDAQLVSELRWLDQAAALIIEKDCVDTWIGAEAPWPAGECSHCGASFSTATTNYLREFLIKRNIKTLVVVGTCTDICVMRFVLSIFSACKKLLPGFHDVVVVPRACTTYEAPGHSRELMHHMGLYLMQQSGAILADNIVFD
ncbi:MAG: isochorismatase family protein [Patescibacteria group bacterium]